MSFHDFYVFAFRKSFRAIDFSRSIDDVFRCCSHIFFNLFFFFNKNFYLELLVNVSYRRRRVDVDVKIALRQLFKFLICYFDSIVYLFLFCLRVFFQFICQLLQFIQLLFHALTSRRRFDALTRQFFNHTRYSLLAWTFLKVSIR